MTDSNKACGISNASLTSDEVSASEYQAWYTYLVACADGSLYCGVTNNLARRLKQHNGELVGGAKYTATRRPVEIKAFWPHQNRSLATQHEYQIKQLSRPQKLALIQQFLIENQA
ncbi:GIY-YIG nuclease family protein [Thiomicrospira sp.]|uniref:GIY-YIG nuclease family protein n=1 Tax=Thiomicrospira sp. TaxID=935 RepID=UPI002F91E15E